MFSNSTFIQPLLVALPTREEYEVVQILNPHCHLKNFVMPVFILLYMPNYYYLIFYLLSSFYLKNKMIMGIN